MSKQISLSNKKIKEKIQFLHSKLSQSPTATDEIFQIPNSLSDRIYESDYSQKFIQELADLIGYYLYLLKPIKVRVGIESSEHMLMGGGDRDRLDRAGLYKVYGYDHAEIEITKKFRYGMTHLLAILVHESMHNYLYYHGIRDTNEEENEILTDLSTAYLGFGHIVYKGYEPITWTDNVKSDFFGTSCTTHTATIGYVTSNTILRAIIEATKLRRFKIENVMKNFNFFDRIYIYLNLLAYIKEQKLFLKDKIRREAIWKKNSDLALNLFNNAKFIHNRYLKTEFIFRNISSNVASFINDNNVNFKIIEILNTLSTGELENKINFIIKQIRELKISYLEMADFTFLQNDISKVDSIVEEWSKILSQLRVINKESNYIICNRCKSNNVVIIEDNTIECKDCGYTVSVKLDSSEPVNFQSGEPHFDSRKHTYDPFWKKIVEKYDKEKPSLMIMRVPPYSEAEKAGIEVGDIITKVCGKEVKTVDAIREALQNRDTTQPVPIELVKNGTVITIRLNLGKDEKRLGLYF